MINFGDPIWEKLHSTRDWGKYPSEEVIKFYKKSITNHKADPKVLDAGAGKGSCSWFMVKEGGNVTAFDGSVSALNSISSLTNEFNLNKNIKTVKGNIINPKKFFKEKFDIIVDNISLCVNLENQVTEAYNQYYDLLNQNGDFLTICLGENSTGFKTGLKISSKTYDQVPIGCMKDRGIITWFDKMFLQKLFIKIGFKIISYTNILNETDSIIIEKHIFHLKK